MVGLLCRLDMFADRRLDLKSGITLLDAPSEDLSLLILLRYSVFFGSGTRKSVNLSPSDRPAANIGRPS